MMITHWPECLEGHPDHDAVSRAATVAFQQAGEAKLCKYIPDCPPYEPLKLYYADLPDPELGEKLGVDGARTELDVSSFTRAKARALRCHKSQEACWRDQIGALRRSRRWTESFWLAQSRAPLARTSEGDLFAEVSEAASYKAGIETRRRRLGEMTNRMD